jgi:hypothetical protein
MRPGGGAPWRGAQSRTCPARGPPRRTAKNGNTVGHHCLRTRGSVAGSVSLPGVLRAREGGTRLDEGGDLCRPMTRAAQRSRSFRAVRSTLRTLHRCPTSDAATRDLDHGFLGGQLEIECMAGAVAQRPYRTRATSERDVATSTMSIWLSLGGAGRSVMRGALATRFGEPGQPTLQMPRVLALA